MKEDVEERLLDLLGTEAQPEAFLEQIPRQHVEEERSDERLKRQDGVDRFEMLSFGVTSQVAADDLKNRVGDVALEDGRDLRIDLDLGQDL